MGRRYFALAGLVVILLALGLVGGVVLDRQVLSAYVPTSNVTQAAQPDFQLMAQAWNIIQKNYVDRQAVNSQTLTYGAIGGMVDALGDTDHSRFLSPQMLSAEHNFTQGQFEGIGAEVQMENGHVVIVAPIDNSPAQKAGLRPGDIILKVNGQDISGLSLTDAVNLILGPAGSKVTLTIQDPTSGASRDVTLERARIALQNVTWSQIPGTNFADVSISAFSDGVTTELKQALTQIQAQHLSGIVLDLRNNPGGLLDQSEQVTSQFLSSGTILEEKNAQGQITKVPVQAGGLATKIPMVVLINQGTASASEILAGALQDNQRAKLVGATTFGTGTVLNEFPLSDGSALLLATEEWLTPTGRVIWHKGIAPDVQVALPTGVIPLSPDALKSLTAAQVQSSQDAQFLKALDLLTQSSASSS